jgi:uncharacterized protein YndB with AHSA1/START domain
LGLFRSKKREVVVKILKLTFLTWCLVMCGVVFPTLAADQPAVKTDTADAQKTLDKLSQLVGGTWVNENPKFVVEFRYEWAFDKKVIRGLGAIDKGGPHEEQGEAILGLDPVNKNVFYLDCHGGETVFKGTVKPEGEDLVFEFTTIIGKPAQWREVLRFTDKDTMQFTIFGDRGGKWVPVVKQTSRRKQQKVESTELVTEGIIEAPVATVWSAFVTKEGQESWNVAHAEIDLKVGGKMRTHYDPKGQLGDPNTIENTILCFEPNRMLAIQVANPPAQFPYKDAIKKMWTVIYLEDEGPSRTRLRLVGTGYGDDEESRKLRTFFEKGNSYTLKKLQEKFAAKGGKPANQG